MIYLAIYTGTTEIIKDSRQNHQQETHIPTNNHKGPVWINLSTKTYRERKYKGKRIKFLHKT